MPRLWRYTTGKKRINRVSVYERTPGGALQIEWWDDLGRHRESLTTFSRQPITDKDDAKEIADEVAAAQKRKRNDDGVSFILGKTGPKTVGDLLTALHSGRWDDWSESYRRDQARFQKFWLLGLGRDTRLRDVTAARVNRIAKDAAEAWSSRTHQSYLRYIVDAFYYAQRDLKWITERHNLSAVRFPKVRTESKAYTDEELDRLLRSMRGVDVRCWAVAEIAYATGRRLNAIRTLESEAVEIDGDVPVVRFPVSTDKARRSGEAVLTRRATESIRHLRAQTRARWLFPNNAGTGPIRRERLIKMLREAEAKAGIPHIKGRAYHGLKRRFATIAEDRRAAAKQSGTTEKTLESHYEQDDLAPKVRLAEALEARRNG